MYELDAERGNTSECFRPEGNINTMVLPTSWFMRLDAIVLPSPHPFVALARGHPQHVDTQSTFQLGGRRRLARYPKVSPSTPVEKNIQASKKREGIDYNCNCHCQCHHHCHFCQRERRCCAVCFVSVSKGNFPALVVI